MSTDAGAPQLPQLPDRPQYRGLLVHRNLRHKFSLLYPDGWGTSDVPRAAGGGVVLSPDGEDPHTSVLVRSVLLPSRVRPTDLPDLHEGLLDGVRQLPGAEIIREKADVVGKLLDAEAEHTYTDAQDGTVRRRWVRLLCQDKVQVSLVAQGSTEERYAYWLPMFTTVMRTVQFADWWAEVTGMSWQKTVEPAEF
jgi:hypothetical protein